MAIEQADSPTNGIALWKTRIDELLAAGTPIEGLGFQGHFSASPTGIPRVKEVLDDFWNSYGLPAKVTEYDIDKLAPQSTQAQYMRDVLTICFAHPSMKGFLMWGFWDGAHWQGNAPIYNQDWTLKPSGEAFIDQVFNLWWTDETVFSTETNFTKSCFKGKYRVTATCPDGTVYEQSLDLTDDASLVFETSCVVATNEQAPGFGFELLPNPANDFTTLRWNSPKGQRPAKLLVHRADGSLVHEEKLDWNTGSLQVQTANWAAGQYTVTVEATDGGRVSRGLVVGH